MQRDASLVSANSGISGFSAISGGGLSAFSNEVHQPNKKSGPKLNTWVEKSSNCGESVLNLRIVSMIVQKLGYSEEEVKRYVKNDPNSFVGVLYQKLLDD